MRVILVRDSMVLLIYHTYRDDWYLPGGGLHKGETLEEAAQREVSEEVGVQIDNLSLAGVYSDFSEGRSDHIIVFSSNFLEDAKITSNEIKEAKFFPLDALPKNIHRGSLNGILEYRRLGIQPQD